MDKFALFEHLSSQEPATPEEFAAAAASLVERDSFQSFTTQAYSVALRVGSEAQQEALEAELKRQKIRTG
jgi:hypothetical protein